MNTQKISQWISRWTGHRTDARTLPDAVMEPGRRYPQWLYYVALFAGVLILQATVPPQKCVGQCIVDHYERAWLCSDGTKSYCGAGMDSTCWDCQWFDRCDGHGYATYDYGCNAICATTPPDTVSVSGGVSCGGGGGGWCNGSATLTLTATDSLGHAVFFDTTGAVTVNHCAAPCSLALPEGTGTVNYVGTCTGGVSAGGSASYQLDVTPPAPSYTISGGTPGLGGYYLAGPVTMNCTGSDNLSGVASIGYSPQTASAEGNTTLRCTVTDVAANSASATHLVPIDGTPPVITADITGLIGAVGSEWHQGAAQLNCTAADAVSGVAGITYGTQSVTADGEALVSCTAHDNAGNSSTYSTTIRLDNTDPNVRINLEGVVCKANLYNSPVLVSMDASDSMSGLAYATLTINDGPNETSRRVYDGVHEAVATAHDRAGNQSGATAKFVVDLTPPVTAWAEAESEWVGGTVTLHGVSTDYLAGVKAVYVSFDNGGTWRGIGADSAWSVSWDTTTVADGAHTLLARADDLACNSEHTGQLTLKVDNTPPGVELEMPSVLMGQNNAILADDAGSGLDHARVTITGPGMIPRVMEVSVLTNNQVLAWDSRDGNGNPVQAGVYAVLVEVWDKVGNFTRTDGRWVGRETPPTAVIPDGSGAWIHADGSEIPPEEDPAVREALQLPHLGIPFWGIFLPLGGIGSWLITSTAAFSRDRRWEEWRNLRTVFKRYRAHKQLNFFGGDEDD